MCAFTGAYLCLHEHLRIFLGTSDGLQHINAHFTSHLQMVASNIKFDRNQLLNELLCSVENFGTRGSDFVFDKVFKFTLVITQLRL